MTQLQRVAGPTGARIVAEARSWVGTPWCKPFMAVKGVMCDCVGVVAGVGMGVGGFEIDPTRSTHYGRHQEPSSGELRKILFEFLVPVRMEEVLLGDVVHVRLPLGPRHQDHLCIVTKDGWRVGGRFVHSTGREPRAVVERGIDQVWHKSTFKNAWRYPTRNYDG